MAFNRRKFMIRNASWMLIVVLLLLWEILCVGLEVPEYLFPAPTAVWSAGIDRWEPIMMHAWQTFFTTLVGFAIAVVVGVVLGIAVGTYPIVYKALYPLLVGFNSIPKVAFVPVLVVWFGIGTVPAILTAFLISFFPVLVNVATGLATLEPELEDVMRSLGASKLDILRKVGLPRALPYFFASLKVAITLAFVGSVISETVASNMGIGYLMMAASSSMDMALVFAGLIVIGVMGVVMYELFAWMEKRFTRWANRGSNSVAV
ncbi:ABC transporter permease [Nitrincola schmidtii]|uniref:ABC transporter permease n=1 Tax=Nitrincola schmidtii TaxID=1730894 RepID=UPI00124DAD00|nr:ABC transporter permease [Nitrincola schmidtii]